MSLILDSFFSFFLQYRGESTSVKKAIFVCWGACAELRDIPRTAVSRGSTVSSGDLGASVFMPVLSLLFSADSIHREPTLCQAGLSQALHLICSSNGPVRWVMLSFLPLKKKIMYLAALDLSCIMQDLSLLCTSSLAVAFGPSAGQYVES